MPTDARTYTLTKLDSGYWHLRFSANQFIQWPVGRFPRPEDGFGWLTPEQWTCANRVADGRD
jgi:hypothetical protein